jgi:pseudaminic acid synthase
MTTPHPISIADRKIGKGHSPYVIAEMSGNHKGDISRALALIDAAKKAGVDAVKLQTYTADTITLDCDRPEFQITDGLWSGRSFYKLYQEAHTPWNWHEKLFNHAKDIGVTIFSSPFDNSAVDLLESLNAPAYKIASFEVVDIGLIKRCAQTGKPIIISTGLAQVDEIEDALKAARDAGQSDIFLLHCVSGYPTPLAEANLARIQDLAERFGVLTGLSDHSKGVEAAIAATALGAVIIEKHFTLSRAEGGVDSDFSLEPDELKVLVDSVKATHQAIGRVHYTPNPSEGDGRKARRSLYVVKDVVQGEVFGPDNIRSIRPGFGLMPKHLDAVIGQTATRNIKRGEPLDWSMVDK